MDKIAERLTLLHELGGLPSNTDFQVSNKEWLYMLEEDARQSLSIEGYFTTEQEFKAVLSGKKSYPEIYNYYRTATWEYDAAFVIYRDFKDSIIEQLSQAITVLSIKQMHSSLFRQIDGAQKIQRGAFRSTSIDITGAKVKPPSYDIDNYIRAFVKLIPKLLETHAPLEALARIHTLFESIHPFPDGNGRVGRILMNFIAISLGLPPIIIKGAKKEDRERYYQALESADKGFHKTFPSPNSKTLLSKLQLGDFEELEELLADSITPQLDTILALLIETTEPLKTLSSLSEILDVKEATLRKRISRGSLIAIKRKNKLYSHERLLLE